VQGDGDGQRGIDHGEQQEAAEELDGGLDPLVGGLHGHPLHEHVGEHVHRHPDGGDGEAQQDDEQVHGAPPGPARRLPTAQAEPSRAALLVGADGAQTYGDPIGQGPDGGVSVIPVGG